MLELIALSDLIVDSDPNKSTHTLSDLIVDSDPNKWTHTLSDLIVGAGLGLTSSPMTPRHPTATSPRVGDAFEDEWHKRAGQAGPRATTAPQMPTGGYRFMISAV